MTTATPSERTILQNFLLPPSALSAAVTLKQFRDLFPAELRDEPAVKGLYRELQHARALQADAVEQNIEAEVKRGARQQRQVARTRRKDAEGELMEGIEGAEIAVERDLFGPSGNAPLPKQHTLETLKPEIARAVEDLEQENAASEAEAERMLNEIRTRISDLSDLKYGHFSKGNSDGQGLAEEVVENLRQLEELCKEGNG